MTAPHALHAPEAERATVAAALIAGTREAFDGLADVVSAADFHDPRCGATWEAFAAVAHRGEVLDAVTVGAELRARGRFEAIGGAAWLSEVTDVALSVTWHPSAARDHAAIVRDHAERRRALAAAEQLAAQLRAGAPLELARAPLEAALRGRAAATAAPVGHDLEALVAQFDRRAEGRERPLPTPWRGVNELLGGGLWPGMYVLVGGTGAGKTQWAVEVAAAAALAGHRALYLALELSRVDLAARVVGCLAGVPWSGLVRGHCPADRAQAVSDAMVRAAGLPFHTEAGAPYGYGAELLGQRAAALRPSLVVLDYLQLCAGRGGEEPRQAVGRVSYVARAVARDLGAVVLVLSSTARANYEALTTDESTDPGALVGLGKESGEIEYAADGVMVLARDKAAPGRRVLVLAKNRHGPLDRVNLSWSGTAFQPEEEGV